MFQLLYTKTYKAFLHTSLPLLHFDGYESLSCGSSILAAFQCSKHFGLGSISNFYIFRLKMFNLYSVTIIFLVWFLSLKYYHAILICQDCYIIVLCLYVSYDFGINHISLADIFGLESSAKHTIKLSCAEFFL